MNSFGVKLYITLLFVWFITLIYIYTYIYTAYIYIHIYLLYCCIYIYILLSLYLSIYLPTYLSIHPSIHLSIYGSMDTEHYIYIFSDIFGMIIIYFGNPVLNQPVDYNDRHFLATAHLALRQKTINGHSIHVKPVKGRCVLQSDGGNHCRKWWCQWPFQDPKLEVPTIYKAYVRPM